MSKHFNPTKEQERALDQTAALIVGLIATGFSNAMEIGRNLASAQNVLGKKPGTTTYWSNWVVGTLKMKLRTAQLYRDVYLNFSPQAESPIEKFDESYLAKVGTTKLARFHTLWKKYSEPNYKGSVSNIVLVPTITLSYLGVDDKTETKDLADMSLSELRLLMRANKPDSSTAENSPPINNLLDALKLDAESIRKVETLRAAIKVLQDAFKNVNTPEPSSASEVTEKVPKSSVKSAKKAA